MHKEQEIKILFRKYIHQNLSAIEMIRLKALMATMEDEQINFNLEQLWLEYSNSSISSPKAFDEVQRNLKTLLKPTVRKLSFVNTWRAVAAVLVPMLIGTTCYLYMDRESIRTSIAKEHTVQVGKGERASVTLPDGTKVYLNSESSLSYSASFALDHRNVSLRGEAYFEVVRNTESPFTVSTAETEVKVLGTTFNIYAYPEKEWIETSLVKGKVEVDFLQKKNNQIVLSPNEKIRYNKKTGQIQHIKTDLWMETAWRRGDLIFHSETLSTVLKQLESFYGMKISVEGQMPADLFTGSFHENEVNMVLRNLQLHYKFTYQKSGDNVIITFK